MTSASGLVTELNSLSKQRENALTAQDNVEADFAIAMGDMLKDGYWNNSNYAIGQEQFLYEDSVDMINQMSKPSVSYSVSLVSLNDLLLRHRMNLALNTPIRIYDPDLEVNDFAYITRIVKHLDAPEDDTVDISNEDITLSGLTLDSILSRITKLADLIDQKNSLYDRAGAISKDGSIYIDRLNGQINVLKNRLSSSTSSWYTDENGNIVFESTNGKSAMMLCGEGFMIAYGRTDDGEWNWRTFGTGEGFTADAIITGYLSADRIEARSITVNKLASDVGQSLDLSSNESIRLAVESTMTNKLSASFISLALNNNSPSTQIFNPNTKTYTPDWSIFDLVVTPSVLVGGLPVSNDYEGLSFQWTRREGNENETELVSGESAANGSLHVSKNLLPTAVGNSITYGCLATYTNEYGTVSSKAELSFVMVESGNNGKDSVMFSIYAPNGSAFTKDVTSLTIKAVGYYGGVDITSSGSLAWEKNTGTEWKAISSSDSVQNISSSDVYSIGSYRCKFTYKNITYIDTITIIDEVDIIIKSDVAPENPIQDMLWLDTSSDVDILKRWNGTEWVECTITQEEVDNIYSSIASYSSELSVLKDSIASKVSSEEYRTGMTNKADVDWVSRRLESIITQTATDIELSFNNSKTFTMEATGEFKDFIEEVRSYQKFSAEGLELGMTNSAFKTLLTNSKLSFTQNGVEIAYISNNRLHITEARVTEKLSIGTEDNGYFDWITTSTGLGLKWRG